MVALTLEKLPIATGDPVRNDLEWEEWYFNQITNALCLLTRRNSVDDSKSEEIFKKHKKQNRVFQTQERKTKTCFA